MDTCGTGGGLGTYNISTATAIVAAAAGIPIAKHGSRSISSLSGSADVLEALGVNIQLTPQQAETLIEEIGIVFIYAPLFHPVMCKVLPSEAALGIKTIFYTIIGPLINPAFAPRHLLGVYKPELLEQVAYVAKEIGYTRAMFVHGLDGLDEISLLGRTKVLELKDGVFSSYEIQPEDFGMKRCTIEEIQTGTPQENAATIRGVFDLSIQDARRDAVILNAAGALIVGGKADDFAAGIAQARAIIDSALRMRSCRPWLPLPIGIAKKGGLCNEIFPSFKTEKKQWRPVVIPDLKCISPKEGRLIEAGHVVDMAVALQQAGAPALSVVTEAKQFGGSLELLRQVVQAVNIPVLRKDFICTEAEIAQSKACGAAAVLLMYACLAGRAFGQFVSLRTVYWHRGSGGNA